MSFLNDLSNRTKVLILKVFLKQYFKGKNTRKLKSNYLLPLDEPIVHLEFKNIEKLGMLDEDRKAIFDLYCHDKKGNQFIAELQRAKQNYFQDRAAYYSTFLIHEQAKKGQWNFVDSTNKCNLFLMI